MKFGKHGGEKKMNHLDLFSGIGGFALAAKWAGFETVWFCEKDKFCQRVLRKHWPLVSIADDIKTFTYNGHVDLLTAGFPCQPFSIAGKKKGKDDDRYLWPEVIRIGKKCRPTWMVLENVPGIIPMLDSILEDLEREAYTWQALLIPASAVGAPHKRERLWIIAHHNSKRFNERGDNRKERHFQDDWKRNVETLQSEWAQFVPESWEAFNAQDWLISNSNSISMPQTDSELLSSRKGQKKWIESECSISHKRFDWKKDQPPIPGVDDGLPNGLDRNKSLGNAIVPQVVYPILKLIYEIENAN